MGHRVSRVSRRQPCPSHENNAHMDNRQHELLGMDGDSSRRFIANRLAKAVSG